MEKNFISAEYSKGNYVIAGGDWNHDIADSLEYFPSQQQIPAWVQQITEEDIPDGFSFAKTLNAPTCRAAEMPYTEGVNYTVVIDGFLVSDNIQIETISNIDTINGKDISFLYSDYNAVKMSFSLISSTEEGGESADSGNETINNSVNIMYMEDRKEN